MSVTASLLDLGFVLLLCGVATLRKFWPKQNYIGFAAFVSALVVGLASPSTLLIIAVITLGYLYPIHLLTLRLAKSTTPSPASSLVVPFGIAGLVGLLVLFKVYRYFSLPFLAGSWRGGELLSLVGFSYFIFRAISFLRVQAILNLREQGPWALLCYTLFPPTLTSGPIHRYQDFREKLAAPLELTGPVLREAGYRITRGYFRKLVLAFVLNEIVSALLGVQRATFASSAATILALYLYFYFDFAGYSDIAIGFGLLLGIRVPENFRKPFLATNISEFWRNWHITLADWFRDHVFIPLGGLRTSRRRASLLALLVMVLCGLWHGLTLSLFVWGVWHGLLLLAEGLAGSKPVPPALRHGPGYWSRVVWTNARVAFGCLFFLPNTATMGKVLEGFAHW